MTQLGGRTTDLRLSRGVDQATTRLERARSAGLAWRPGSELSLLKELQMRWEHLRYRRVALKGRSGRTSADADYLRRISGAEDGEDGSQR